MSITPNSVAPARKQPPVREVGQQAPVTQFVAPLSSVQQRVWRLERSRPGFYYSPVALRLRFPLSPGRLLRSFAKLLARHEILRSIFTEYRGAPVQVVAPLRDVHLPIIDLSGLPHRFRDGLAGELLWTVGRMPFDLARGPLIRPLLVRVGAADHVFHITAHHLVFDGSSQDVLIRDISSFYFAGENRDPGLPPLRIQYRDHARRTALEEKELSGEAAYWGRQLSPPRHVLRLPFDRPRPANPSYAGARTRVRFETAAITRLRSLAQQEGATLFMVMAAVLTAFLWQSSNGDDIIIGVPVENRLSMDTEELIGPFVNILALRSRVDEQRSLRDLVGQVRQVTLQAFANQRFPFDSVLRMLWPEKELSNYGVRGEAPLFQACFDYHTVASENKGPLALTPFEHGSVLVGCDVFVAMLEGPNSVESSFAFTTDLFHRSTGFEMARHLERLTAWLARWPDERLSAFARY
jgi:hypothetical protein